jgi:hypothetical protein
MDRSLDLSEWFEMFAHRIRERKRKQRNEDDCWSNRSSEIRAAADCQENKWGQVRR